MALGGVPPPGGPGQQAVAGPARPLAGGRRHQACHPRLVRHRHQEDVQCIFKISIIFLGRELNSPSVHLEAFLHQ